MVVSSLVLSHIVSFRQMICSLVQVLAALLIPTFARMAGRSHTITGQIYYFI